MSGGHFALIEMVLVFAGVVAFAWWQFRSLKRDRAITEARLRDERNDRPAA